MRNFFSVLATPLTTPHDSELDFDWFIIALYLYISGDILKNLPSVELKHGNKICVSSDSLHRKW